MHGRPVYESSFGNKDRKTIDLEDVEKGVYFLRILEEEKVRTRRIIVR
jgi:hypothetical protein